MRDANIRFKNKLLCDGVLILIKIASAGLMAGFCNGLFGAGGGIAAVVFFSCLMKNAKGGEVYANALALMLPLSVFTLGRYMLKNGGDLIFKNINLSIISGAVLGGIFAGIILPKLKPRVLGKVFASLTVLSGILMLTR